MIQDRISKYGEIKEEITLMTKRFGPSKEWEIPDSTYLNPIEMKVFWHGNYNKIPEEDLICLRRNILYMVHNTELYSVKTCNDMKSSTSISLANAGKFYFAWKIEKFREVYEAAKKYISYFTL